MKEASFYKKLPAQKVQCRACNRFCLIEQGSTGKCGVRKNIDGKLFSLVYGKTLTLTVDPIEKKPLFNFRPGTSCLGISTYGCNFLCKHCQNYDISQQRDEAAFERIPETPPGQIVEKTLEAGAEGIAYTYTEPTIFVEYALDTMKLAKKRGLYNVWVSNGYMSREVIDEIAPFLDAINIDLKGNAAFYKEVCIDARIEAVMENIAYFDKKKIHCEVTNLVIPGFNDNEKEFREISEFIYGINPMMPLHFTRFYPLYKMAHLPATDESKLKRAKEIAEKAGLKYVYLGNLSGEESTFCPKCKNLLIKRIGYTTKVEGLDKKGKCKKCGAETGIIV